MEMVNSQLAALLVAWCWQDSCEAKVCQACLQVLPVVHLYSISSPISRRWGENIARSFAIVREGSGKVDSENNHFN